jgi:methyl-accepting chemotaxis protein
MAWFSRTDPTSDATWWRRSPILAALDASLARVVFTPNGVVTDANQRFLDLMGYTAEEVRGQHHTRFVAEADRDGDAYGRFWDALRSGTFRSGEFPRVTKSGRRVWLRATYSPVRDDRGEVQAIIKLADDVTSQVEAREADAEMRQRLSEMVENTSVRLILADRDSTIVYMNPASLSALRRLERHLPCKADEIVGRSFDIFHAQPARQRSIVADPANLPHHTRFPLGDEWLDLTASALKDRSGRYMGPLVTWEVVTEQVRAERALQELAREIREAADQQTDGARIIAESSTGLSEGAQ